MKRLLNAVLIFMILMVFMFIGVSSVMAYDQGFMVGNQIVIENQNMVAITAECPDREFLFNYKNINTKTAPNAGNINSPAPTFHVGKINRSSV